MKKYSIYFLIFLVIGKAQTCFSFLPDPPQTITQYKEIAVTYNQHLAHFYNNLTPQERVFIYYLFRASLPGNIIASDQLHQNTVEITNLLENVLEHKSFVLEKSNELTNINLEEFFDDLTIYLVYLWANHSQYFMREFKDEKRTPASIGLKSLNQDNLTQILKIINYPNAEQNMTRLAPPLFNKSFESTLTVPGSINESAINFYAKDFTDEDFYKLNPNDQTRLNAYFYVVEKNNQRLPASIVCKVGGKYNKELSVSLYWLEKAYDHVSRFPEQFDEHFIKSLKYLCDFIKTGDEEVFKKHSIEWLKSKSTIDYCFGFIESYADPKSYRAVFQAEATLKSINMEKVNTILPNIEAQLPFPEEFKRESLGDIASLPNASVNTRLFTMGSLGPLNIFYAYCLPNYEEIRSQHGSKQIIYQSEKNVGELTNPTLYKQLFYCKESQEWIKINDPNLLLGHDILNLHVMLHETIGHGSGRLDTHTFVKGDLLIIEGSTHSVGDTIPVTSSNIQQFLLGYNQTIEELRAEVIALLSSIICYDEITKAGLLKDWPSRIEKSKMQELFIVDMTRFALFKLLTQPEDTNEIFGDHARANMTILNYLVEHGGIELVEEEITVNEIKSTILDIRVTNLEKAIKNIKKLAILVQTIRPTGDGQSAALLIDTYGKKIPGPTYIKIMKENLKTVAGDLKATLFLYPTFQPIIDDEENIIDIQTSWPRNIVDQYRQLRELTYSKN